MNKHELPIHFVYEHWRPDKDVCFYVGKGHGKRANDMGRSRNPHHKRIQAKLARLGMCVEVRLVAEGMTHDEAIAFEIERIAFWRGIGVKLTNITAGGEGTIGLKHTDEWKRAQSERMKGRVTSPETRAKLAAAAIGNQRGLGKTKSPEVIARTVAKNRGKKRSEEYCVAMRARLRANPPTLGRHHTEEAKEKLRLAHRGRVRSEETRVKMRKPKSEEHKRKLSEANIGKKHSEKTINLLSDISRARAAARKQAAGE